MIAWFLSGKRPRAILNVHSLTLTPSLLSRYIENTIDKSVVESSKYVIGVSKSCVESLRNRKNFSNKTNLKYIYNGIVDPTAADVLDDEYLNVSESINDEYVLMLASYDVYKGYEFLMDAFKIVLLEFPDIKIKIYGYGLPKKKETIREIVSRLELQSSVSLNDFSSDVVKLYAHAKILVVPSQSFESFGLTIIEAMAHGVPVVATEVGGIPEVLYKSYAGFMCSKDDPVSFANAIKKLLRDPSLAKMMGQNGRNTYMQRFTAARMSFEYWTLIKDSEVDIINE
jgi:glycosyltransferase involved in cell wall biosynthesis